MSAPRYLDTPLAPGLHKLRSASRVELLSSISMSLPGTWWITGV